MTDKLNEKIGLDVVDRHIEELNQRIDHLEQRMATMTSQRYETKNQSILLSTMQAVLKDLHLLRSEMPEVKNAKDSHLQACYQAAAHRNIGTGFRRGKESLGAN